jgi:MFS family permease
MSEVQAAAPLQAAADKGEGAYAWWVVFVLCAAQIVSSIDRAVINLLVEPIKRDLLLTDTQVSLIQGFAFAIFYALMALPLGRWADLRNRRNLIIYGVLLWSAATFACGLAGGFLALFTLRMLVGVGEATLTPAGMSILADTFAPERAARPISLFTGASFMGTGLALIGGGFVLQQLTALGPVTLPVFGQLPEWRLAFMIAALPGLLVVLMLCLVREPERRVAGPKEEAGSAIKDTIGFFTRHRGLLVPIYLGLPVLAAGQFALGAWIPSFFIRTHGMSAPELGYAYGLIVSIFGAGGVALGGWLADLVAARGQRDAGLRIAVYATLAAIPLAIAFPLAPSMEVSLAIVAALAVLGAAPFGPGVSVLPIVSPPRMKAQLAAVYLLVANLVGVAGGPLLVAFVSDTIVKDPMLIRYSLATVVPILMALGALILSFGFAPLRRRMAEMAEARLAP